MATEDEMMSFPALPSGKDLREQLRRAFDELDAHEKSALQLHYGCDMGQAEIATILKADSEATALEKAQSALEKGMNLPAGSLQDPGFEEAVRQEWPHQISDEELDESQRNSWRRIKKAMDKHDLEFRSLYHNGNDHAKALRDLQILAAIHSLGGESNFGRISAIADGWSRHSIKPAFVYAALDRLEACGAIASRFSDRPQASSTPERIFAVTAMGESRLATAHEQALARVTGEKWNESDPAAWGLTEAEAAAMADEAGKGTPEAE